MAVTTGPRLGLTRWSAGGDPFRRAQMDESHRLLEEYAARTEEGAGLANRPAAGIRDRYWTDTTTGVTYRDTGAAWTVVGGTTAGLVVHRAASGQAGPLASFRDSAGVEAASVGVDGALTGKQLVATGRAGVPALVVTGADPGQPTGRLKMAAAQTADALAVEDSGGVRRAGVTAAGRLEGRGLAATAGAATDVVLDVKLAAGATGRAIRVLDAGGAELASVDGAGALAGKRGTFLNDAAASVPLLVRHAANPTADLAQFQGSTGAVLSRVRGDGVVEAPGLRAFATDAAAATSVARGAAAQSANLAEWQNSAGGVLARVDSAGSLHTVGNVNAGDYVNGRRLRATATAAADVPLAVKAAASPTGNLTEWQNSAGVVLAQVLADGSIATNSLLRAGPSTIGNGQLRVTTGAPATVGVAIRGAASQTANLTEWQDSAGATLAYLSAGGMLRATRANFLGADAAQPVQIVRAAVGQSVNLTEWQNSAGGVLASLSPSGRLKAEMVGVNSEPAALGATLGVLGTSTTAEVLAVRPGAAQTADVLAVQDDAGAAWARFQPGGTLRLQGIGSPNLMVIPAGNLTAATLRGGTAAQTADIQKWQTNAGSDIARITATGNVQGTGAYTILSDRTNKQNIRDLDDRDALAVIDGLRPVRFDYVAGEGNQLGFIAQDVAPVLPEAVVGFGSGRLGLRDGAITAVLVAAVQELTARVRHLEAAAA